MLLVRTVYGFDGALPPQMLLQPVALATTMRSPNICVSSFTYGVSPQPCSTHDAHESEAPVICAKSAPVFVAVSQQA
jgi:hypothetical protein